MCGIVNPIHLPEMSVMYDQYDNKTQTFYGAGMVPGTDQHLLHKSVTTDSESLIAFGDVATANLVHARSRNLDGLPCPALVFKLVANDAFKALDCGFLD